MAGGRGGPPRGRRGAPGREVPAALVELSRGLAEARTEEEIAGLLARALEALFPGRSFCIHLVDAKSLATTTIYARGRLLEPAPGPLRLRPAALRAAGLSEAVLSAAGVEIVGSDRPLCQGTAHALAVPIAAGGALLGVLDLEWAEGQPADPAREQGVLDLVASHAALGLRNLRSIEELTFLKTWLEELLENANALIVVTNRQREVLLLNRAVARLTGRGREEALGADLLGLLPAEERERAAEVLERSIAGEAVSGFETRLLLRGGGLAPVAFHTAPIAGQTGEVEGVIAIGQDLTPLRAMEARAEHFQRLAALGRLAAGVVHELNNPLVAIQTYSDSLLERHGMGGLDPADLDKLRRIREAGERIQKFSRDLLSYARPSGDPPERLDLGALLEQAARMCEPALRQAGARLRLTLAPAPRIRGVRSSLLQVFVNLVTNAAQALAPGGGEVALSLSAGDGEVVAEVRDDGTGMDDEVRARLFEPFFTTKQGGRGAGLGLPIVQGIVARHGGRIEVESAPGRGATFRVTLPVGGGPGAGTPSPQGTSERIP
jgi:PAS domain S-box-containing protein